MSKWRKIKVGYSDGSGGITDNDGATLTTDDKDEDTVVIGGHDDWGVGVGVLQGDEADRLVACWNACLNLENPEQDIPKIIEALKNAKLEIEYLHDKFTKTGTGNQCIAQIINALSLYKE